MLGFSLEGSISDILHPYSLHQLIIIYLYDDQPYTNLIFCQNKSLYYSLYQTSGMTKISRGVFSSRGYFWKIFGQGVGYTKNTPYPLLPMSGLYIVCTVLEIR